MPGGHSRQSEIGTLAASSFGTVTWHRTGYKVQVDDVRLQEVGLAYL